MTANKNYQWLLIGVLSMHFGVVFFDRNAFSFLTPNIQEEMKLSLTQIGLIGGAFSAAWALAGLVMGSLSDRFGHRKAILIVATLVFALSSVLSGLAPTFVLLLGARMLMGVAEGGIMPITQTLIATEVAPERRGLAQGITQNFGANLLANSLGPIIVAWMATHYGWRNAFYLVAIPGFVMALVIALCVREPQHPKDRPKPTFADSVKLLQDPTILVCVGLSILLVAYFVVWSSFMPLFLMKNKGFSQQAMGGIMSAMGFASIAIAFIVPGLSDRLGRKPVAIVAGVLGAVMPLGALLIDSTSPVPYYAAFAIGATVTGVFPMAMATIPSEIVPPALTATALSLTMGISEVIGGVIGPPAAGWMGDAFGLGAAMWILAAVSIGVAVVALLLRETAPLVLARRAKVPEFAGRLMAAQEFDYLIIGAGTAGCVLAARLSEDPTVQVCLIEAGPRDTHPAIQVPALVGVAISRPALNWRFMTEPQPQLDNRRIPLPRGRVVGGSGSINGMAYFRGQPRDFDDWAAAGCKGWSWREVLPYFIRSEHNQDHQDSPLHGHDGPINVRHIRRPNRLNQAFLSAFAMLGEYPRSADLTGLQPEGYGLRQGTIRNGRRDSTANAFLRPALSRPNLTLLTDSPVRRILLDGGVATGVEIDASTGPAHLRARREVLLCAGAVQSPQLLMLSGVGDAAELRQHGIAVHQHLPGVGGNYHDHLAVSILMETRNTLSYGLSLRTAHRALWNGLQYALWRDGPLASNLFESTAFIRSSKDADRPDLQLVFQPARRNRGTFPLPLGHGFAISSVGLYPHSRGRVHLASSDPAAAPRVAANFLADPRDLQPLLFGLKLARRLFASEPFRYYAAQEVAPGPAVTDDAGLTAYLRRIAASVHHPVGTCRMGVDDGAVVDPELRVHGIRGLRVVDASVCPHVVGGNTNAGVVMIAEKASDMILNRSPPVPCEFSTGATA